jgi:hypothetical protein
MQSSELLEYIKSKTKGSDKKILICLPESAGDIFLSTSLLPSFREHYPDYDLYYACKQVFHPVLKDNPHLKGVLEYHPQMEDPLFIEGHGKWEGCFDILFTPAILTQRRLQYLHNGLDVVGLELKK